MREGILQCETRGNPAGRPSSRAPFHVAQPRRYTRLASGNAPASMIPFNLERPATERRLPIEDRTGRAP
jgi:hypothetical protein